MATYQPQNVSKILPCIGGDISTTTCVKSGASPGIFPFGKQQCAKDLSFDQWQTISSPQSAEENIFRWSLAVQNHHVAWLTTPVTQEVQMSMNIGLGNSDTVILHAYVDANDAFYLDVSDTLFIIFSISYLLLLYRNSPIIRKKFCRHLNEHF